MKWVCLASTIEVVIFHLAQGGNGPLIAVESTQGLGRQHGIWFLTVVRTFLANKFNFSYRFTRPSALARQKPGKLETKFSWKKYPKFYDSDTNRERWQPLKDSKFSPARSKEGVLLEQLYNLSWGRPFFSNDGPNDVRNKWSGDVKGKSIYDPVQKSQSSEGRCRIFLRYQDVTKPGTTYVQREVSKEFYDQVFGEMADGEDVARSMEAGFEALLKYSMEDARAAGDPVCSLEVFGPDNGDNNNGKIKHHRTFWLRADWRRVLHVLETERFTSENQGCVVTGQPGIGTSNKKWENQR